MPDPYWSQFAHVWVFSEERPKIKGVLEGRKQDGPRDDPYPVLMFRTESGYKIQVNVTQTRLLAELVRLRPDVGDIVEIAYDGQAPKAPPGLSPVKEFTVHVERKGSQPPSNAKSAGGTVQNTQGSGAGK